jgi:toxin ParE1/3/4
VTHTVRFSGLARDDVDAAFQWYQAMRPGLGDELLVQVEAVLARLSRHPESAPRYLGDTRRVPLRRFPYAVYYLARTGLIEVIGLRPFAGDPAAVLARLPE